MSQENTQCYWTAVPRAVTPPGHPVPYWYVRDVDGKMDFTQDVVDAMRFNIDSPHDKGLIEEALKEKGMHMTMQAGPRLSLDGLEFSLDQVPDDDGEEEFGPALRVTIDGRQDAVLILGRLIAQNHVLLLGTEEKEIDTSPLQRLTDNHFHKTVTIRIKN